MPVKMFMASFYMRGINWMDMALLKVSNVQGDFDRINYLRQKTKNKHKKLNKRLKEIAAICEIAPFTIYNARNTLCYGPEKARNAHQCEQDSLGHTTEEMTKNSLDFFENTVVDQADEMLFG